MRRRLRDVPAAALMLLPSFALRLTLIALVPPFGAKYAEIFERIEELAEESAEELMESGAAAPERRLIGFLRR